MARAAQCGAGNMIRRFTLGNDTIMAVCAHANYFVVVHLCHRLPSEIRMTGIAIGRGLNMRCGLALRTSAVVAGGARA